MYRNVIKDPSLTIVEKFEKVSELSEVLHQELRESFEQEIGQEIMNQYNELIQKSEDLVNDFEVSIENEGDKFFIVIDDQKKPLLTSTQIAAHLQTDPKHLDLIRLFLSNEETLLRINLVLK